MKVLHVIPSISPLRGGPSQAVIEMVRTVRKEGIDAYVIATQDNGIFRNPELPLNEWFSYKGVPLFLHACIDSKLRGIREFQISPSLISWLATNIGNYDIVHFHAIFSFPTSFGMLVARLRKVPYIVRTIGQLNSWSLSQGALKKRLMLWLIERRNLEKASAIHVTSTFELNDVRLLGLSNKIINLGVGVNIPQAVDQMDRIHANSVHRKTRFLFLSRIHPKKQLGLLLESLELLRYEMEENDWELIIAGTGEANYIEVLKKQALQRGLQEHLTWSGHVTGHDKDEIMKSSDWFVLLSSSENFGISAVEAMAASLPIIITKNVGISEDVLKYKAGYVCSENIREIASLLRFVLKSKDHDDMRKSARRLVEENYSWKSIGQSLSSVYKDYSHNPFFPKQ
jgi:glycosyltransferase involved in cell wall biosynthesis